MAANHGGAAARAKLAALREALAAARERTELDPFDEAMFNAVQGLLEASEAQSAALDAAAKAARKLDRRLG